MSAWDDLVASAVQGTTRRPPDPGAWLADLGLDAAELTGEPPDRLLDAAALATAARRAGARPLTGLSGPEPAPPEPARYAPSGVLAWLPTLLATRDPVLITELFTGLVEQNLAVPPAAVPDLLTLAVGRRDLAAVIVAACGTRADWLIAQNPLWAPLAVAVPNPDDDTPWREGSLGVRTAWLAALLRARPAAGLTLARDVVTTTREPANVRQAVVDTLSGYLREVPDPEAVSEIEQILETALDDRAQGVRSAATQVLAVTDGSRYSRRMTARATTWLRAVQHRRVLSTQTRLVVTVPTAIDKEAVRDGLDPAARPQWLRQVVAATPLAAWSPIGTPAELVALPVDGGSMAAVHTGWAHRAAAEGNQPWADALLQHPAGHGRAIVMTTASPAALAEYITGLLAQAVTDPKNRPNLLVQLGEIPSRWPEQVLDGLLRLFADWRPTPHQARQAQTLLENQARYQVRITPTLQVLTAALHQVNPGWGQAVAAASDILRLRARVRATLEAPDTEPGHPPSSQPTDPEGTR